MIPAGALAYVAIYLAAIVEGEVVFVAASVLVASGQLERWPVLVAGALGAATGDQMYFYALRGRIAGWLTRFKPIAARQDAIVARVQRHRSLMILALRFAPGPPDRDCSGVRVRTGAARTVQRIEPDRRIHLGGVAPDAGEPRRATCPRARRPERHLGRDRSSVADRVVRMVAGEGSQGQGVESYQLSADQLIS